VSLDGELYMWIAPTPSGGVVSPQRPAAFAIYQKAHAEDDVWDIYASTDAGQMP